MSATRCCAICTGTTGPFTREPLGRDDAVVNVCAECASPPIAKHGPEISYQPEDRCPSVADSRRARAPEAAWVGGHPLDVEPGKRWTGGPDKRARGGNRTEQRRRRRLRQRGLAANVLAANVLAAKMGR